MKILGYVLHTIGCLIVWYLTEGFLLPFVAMALMCIGQAIVCIEEGIGNES